ncbi:MAG: methionine adenosyltransferase domain-containing protein, partial [Flavobacteriales bacterium]
IVAEIFDMKPASIVERFGLKNPVFSETAAYGHFGRECYTKEEEVYYKGEGVTERDGKLYKQVEVFAWEKLDKVQELRDAFEMDDVAVLPHSAY